jgi:nicotinate phosphoribosyltransferase
MQAMRVETFSKSKSKIYFYKPGTHSFPQGFAEELRHSVDAMSSLKLSKEEKLWLYKTCPYLDPVYLDFLDGYCYDPLEVKITQKGDKLEVFVEGLWYRTILWEVPLLCLISESFFAMQPMQRQNDERVIEKTKNKIEAYGNLGVTVAEFGTRRRHSFNVHQLVVAALKKYGKTFVGTSNVHLAMVNEIRPIGTHAHEWFMFHAAKYGFKNGQHHGPGTLGRRVSW